MFGVRQAAGPLPRVAAAPAPPSRFTGLRRLAGRVPRSVALALLAFAIYLTVFITVYGLPFAEHPGVPLIRAYWTDPNFYVWSLRWWPYAVTHGLNPLYSAQIGAPHGYSLAWAATTPTVALAMWPVTAAFGVIVAYNVMLLVIPPVSALCAFIAARHLTKKFWPALLAGAVYGFSDFVLLHDWQGQPNLTLIALFPLMVYLMLRWWEGTLRTAWFILWLALVMAVQFYTFSEFFVDMTVVWAGGLVIGFLVAGRKGRPKVARLALHTAIAYAGAIALAAPYLYVMLRHYAGSTLTRQNAAYDLYLNRLIVPWSNRVFGIGPLVRLSDSLGRRSIENYVGLPLILVAVALAVFAWRSGLARLLLFVFVFVIALAAGPQLIVGTQPVATLPWGKLWNLPVVRSAEPSRFIVFAILALSIALALWLATPSKNRLRMAARWALGLLAVAAVLADGPTAYRAVDPLPFGFHPPATMRPVHRLPPFLTDGLYRQYLRPGEIVAVITYRGNAAMLFQADTNFYFRIDGGYINASLTPVDATPPQVEAMNDPNPGHIRQFKSYVKKEHVGAILVERNWAQPWMLTSFARAGLHGTSVGGVIVYPTGSGTSKG
ncbi:MAG TPA: hypothetical protein VFO01_05375 [Trebonia sp.]|nr:hypothetical protein [Trebonia sp.]